MVALLVFWYGTETSEPAVVVIAYLPYLLVTGYAYVALIHIGQLAFTSCGLIKGDEGAV